MVSLCSQGNDIQMGKAENMVLCVFVLYLSLLLRGFEEQCINHCNGVSLNVLIRPVLREIKSKKQNKAAI